MVHVQAKLAYTVLMKRSKQSKQLLSVCLAFSGGRTKEKCFWIPPFHIRSARLSGMPRTYSFFSKKDVLPSTLHTYSYHVQRQEHEKRDVEQKLLVNPHFCHFNRSLYSPLLLCKNVIQSNLEIGNIYSQQVPALQAHPRCANSQNWLAGFY